MTDFTPRRSRTSTSPWTAATSTPSSPSRAPAAAPRRRRSRSSGPRSSSSTSRARCTARAQAEARAGGRPWPRSTASATARCFAVIAGASDGPLRLPAARRGLWPPTRRAKRPSRRRPARRAGRHGHRPLADGGPRLARRATRRHPPRHPAHRRPERERDAGLPRRPPSPLRGRVPVRLPRRRHGLGGRRAAVSSSALLGTVDIVAGPEDWRPTSAPMMRGAMAKPAATSVCVWTPRGATVRFVKQVAPTIEDLTDRGVRLDERTVDFPTGAWGREAGLPRRHRRAARRPGDEMLAGRVSLVVDGEARRPSLVRAVWTDDVAMSTRINPQVAHYTGRPSWRADPGGPRGAREPATTRRPRPARPGRPARGGERERRHPAAAGRSRRHRGCDDRHGTAASGCRRGRRDGPRHPLDEDRPGEAGVNDGEPDDADGEGSAELTPGTDSWRRGSRRRLRATVPSACPPPHRGSLLRTVRPDLAAAVPGAAERWIAEVAATGSSTTASHPTVSYSRRAVTLSPWPSRAPSC